MSLDMFCEAMLIKGSKNFKMDLCLETLKKAWLRVEGRRLSMQESDVFD